tara:strand:- start:615 stop:1280 length:666 start_codon:yes stop_codon:yes gene_type:complete
MAFKMKRPMIMGTPVHTSALKKASAFKTGDHSEDGHKHSADGTITPVNLGNPVPDSHPAKEENKPTDVKTKKKSAYDTAKEKNKDLDNLIKIRGDKSKSEQERADAQDKINEAYGKGPTDRGDKLRKKKEAENKTQEKKDTPKQETKKADTKPDTKATTSKPDVNNAEDRKKMSHKEIFKAKQAKRKAKRAKGKALRAAIDKWRAGGSKGPMPTRSTIKTK